MHGDQTFLAVIPARAGSKGIPGKNVIPVGGRPLIEHTIAAAMGSAHLDTVCVTSDDPRVLDLARAAGIAVVERPQDLADDKARSIDVVLHAIESVKPRHDAVVLLQPTSPLRTALHIDEAIELYVRTGMAVAGVSPVQESPVLVRTMSEGAVLTPILTGASTVRRQDMPEYWRVNGSVYVNPVDVLSPATSLNDNPAGYRMDVASGVDIDEPVDVLLAERLLKGATYVPANRDARLAPLGREPRHKNDIDGERRDPTRHSAHSTHEVAPSLPHGREARPAILIDRSD